MKDTYLAKSKAGFNQGTARNRAKRDGGQEHLFKGVLQGPKAFQELYVSAQGRSGEPPGLYQLSRAKGSVHGAP